MRSTCITLLKPWGIVAVIAVKEASPLSYTTWRNTSDESCCYLTFITIMAYITMRWKYQLIIIAAVCKISARDMFWFDKDVFYRFFSLFHSRLNVLLGTNYINISTKNVTAVSLYNKVIYYMVKPLSTCQLVVLSSMTLSVLHYVTRALWST